MRCHFKKKILLKKTTKKNRFLQMISVGSVKFRDNHPQLLPVQCTQQCLACSAEYAKKFGKYSQCATVHYISTDLDVGHSSSVDYHYTLLSEFCFAHWASQSKFHSTLFHYGEIWTGCITDLFSFPKCSFFPSVIVLGNKGVLTVYDPVYINVKRFTKSL